MHKVTPKVFLIGETRIVEDGLNDYLEHIGIPDWASDGPSDSEKLIEFYGRLCYRSFEPGMNANVTRIREGNDKYIGNILNVGHGSVIEHAMLNFVFADVFRVLTHELVRHRQGTAISQESLRFVRLTELGLWVPTCIQENPEAVALFEETFKHLEGLQLKLAETFDLDNMKNFGIKKVITSAMRRIAPIGLVTTIGWSVNPRALRHIIEMRTSRHAEEEIRIIFCEVARIVIERYPNVFSGYDTEEVDGLLEYTTKNRKV